MDTAHETQTFAIHNLSTGSSLESEFRATELVQQSTGREVAKSLPHVVVKLFS